jgi:uncharacterized membrane protein
VNADNRDLAAVAAAAIVCAAVVVTVPLTAMRTVFAVPLCLVLPGYALTAAGFARDRVRAPQLVMLVPALSLATLALGALLLNLVPGGLRVGSWTALILVVVLGASGLAIARRVSGDAPTRRRLHRVRPRDAILLIVGIGTVCGGLVLSRIPLSAPNALGYTTLWMLSNGTPQAPAVEVGVISAEKRQSAYRLVLRTSFGSSAVVASNLVLKPGGKTEFEVPLTKPASGLPSLITADLYQTGSASVYRHVTALISPAKKSS